MVLKNGSVGSSALVLMAALNEEEGIGLTIKEVKQYLTGLVKTHYLVVDGKSQDKTVDVAKSLGADVVFQEGKGKGDAINYAIQYLNQNEIDYVVLTDADYTNPIVTNKLTTIWLKFTDPLDNTYQGMHFYFNHWEASEAIEQMNIALSRGVTKILNTEIGAHSDEYEAFTQQNVDELETFLMQSQALGVNNCIWMNDDTENWQGYTLYDFTFDTPIQNP